VNAILQAPFIVLLAFWCILGAVKLVKEKDKPKTPGFFALWPDFTL
jgi:hypothetical protein